MRYVQRDLREKAEISSGGGTRGALREAATLALLGAALLVTVYFAVGLITDAVLSRLSVEREKSLFAVVHSVSGSEAVPTSMEDTWKRANESLDRLKVVAGVPALDYELIYSHEPDANALALPGGGIVVTQGLLESVGDEEIALDFVLGHELGHFAHRDHLRGLGRRLGFQLSLALLFGLGTDALTQRSSELIFLRYSRRQERAADQFGLRCLEQVHGSVEGAEKFFETLRGTAGLPRWAYMFSTHPDMDERIREMQAAAED